MTTGLVDFERHGRGAVVTLRPPAQIMR